MDDLAFWRNIALVFLVLQFFVIVMIGVAVSYLLLRLTANLHVYAKRGATKAQEVSQLVVEKSDLYADKARAPIIKGNAVGSGIVAGVRAIFAEEEKLDDIMPPGNLGPGTNTGSES